MAARDRCLDPIPRTQLGALYAREARDLHPDRAWHEVEPLIGRLWERERPGDWSRSRPMVREFWRKAR
ncbi:hypothetical protein E4582_03990 [Luteimonas yindakuii]|uniref:Uncharacterized protein n=1 Tax=Luteimonas yindakuii TaxID=2565782 RepID=A0A4Z1RCX2_9GAMM|nr:hypothetical protein [Luteimonas yindakuii]TKS54013.1 hypothetical protein E4582_03990 [Luteimonas yindakuii]